MNKAIASDFIVDKANKKISVERSFEAPLYLVWAAWTEADILDQWWAPKPWRAETKSMNFVKGGRWHYSMVSPEGERHWCLFDFETIVFEKSFSGTDAFCDEEGIINDSKPRVYWSAHFEAQEDETLVKVDILFETLQDMETIIQMGFKEGFSMGLTNLEQYINAQFYLRNQKKPNNRIPRVSIYLNFDGNTEEAFTFYKKVFKTDFVGGLQRFGDMPAHPEQPPMTDNIKNKVLHVELPLLGGHILMGTDAPEEMGFSVVKGNNTHINIEPTSKTEAERIFVELSDGGTITMPLQDMFWGAYYGSFTDKFGVNWMVNYQY